MCQLHDFVLDLKEEFKVKGLNFITRVSLRPDQMCPRI